MEEDRKGGTSKQEGIGPQSDNYLHLGRSHAFRPQEMGRSAKYTQCMTRILCEYSIFPLWKANSDVIVEIVRYYIFFGICLEVLLSQYTCSMLAVPVHFAG